MQVRFRLQRNISLTINECYVTGTRTLFIEHVHRISWNSENLKPATSQLLSGTENCFSGVIPDTATYGALIKVPALGTFLCC